LNEIYGGLAKVGAVSPPLNLLLLAAILREKGYDPYIFDCPAQGIGYQDIIRRLSILQPKFVGLTAMTPHIMQAAKVTRVIKEHLPQIMILLGGAHISAVPEQTMDHFHDIDVGFLGEADHSLPEFLDTINGGGKASTVKGTINREGGGLINTGQRIERVKLDTLPMYAWDLLEGFPREYNPPLFATHHSPATPILTSRGCPGKCTFCFSGSHTTISTYSAEYTINMLKHLKERYSIREFMIYDDNFVMFRKNLNELLNRLIEERLELSWSCNARVDMVNEEMLNLMAKAGCWQISYGIETGNQAILDALHKKITKEQVQETIKLTHKAGIRSVGYFMIGHFSETLQTIEETIQFACGLQLDDFRMSFFTPLPGTEASLVADQFGEFDHDWSKMNLFSPVFIPKGLSREQLIQGQKRAIQRFFFRPKIVLSYLKMVRNPLIALKGAFSLGQYIFKN
jgi:radical SAM superfamily enzyme YgiQ (UPF0313 family)